MNEKRTKFEELVYEYTQGLRIAYEAHFRDLALEEDNLRDNFIEKVGMLNERRMNHIIETITKQKKRQEEKVAEAMQKKACKKEGDNYNGFVEKDGSINLDTI